MEIQFILTREARKGGGDRFEADLKGEDKPFVVYFPQTISRPNGQVKETITIKLS